MAIDWEKVKVATSLRELRELNMPTSDCVDILYNMVRDYEVKTILELGVEYGVTTRAFLLACRDFDATLTSIDVELPKFSLDVLGDLKKYWRFIRGNDLEVEWNTEVDLIFIDTIHTYDHLKAELEKYHRYARLIVLHDTNDPKWLSKGYLRALKEFLRNHPEWEEIYLGTKHGLTLLRRKG